MKTSPAHLLIRPIVAKRRHRTWSTLPVTDLTWLIISESCGIGLRAISQEMPKVSLLDKSFAIINLGLQSHLPRANDLMNIWQQNYLMGASGCPHPAVFVLYVHVIS